MSVTKKKSVVVVGSANMDMVTTMKQFPRPGETVFGETFGMFPGGKGANQAVCAAKLGARVSFIGKVGSDVLGQKLVSSLRKNGVDLDNLMTNDGAPTGTAIISVDATGQNEIVVVSGSNMELMPRDILAKKVLFTQAAVVLTQLENPIQTVAAALRLAKRQRAITILNPAPATRLPAGLLKYVDYLTPNERETEILTGIRVTTRTSVKKAAQVLLRRGVKNVIVTLGSRGCILVNREGAREFPALKVKALDTTAAGDAFNGALACALANGNSLEEGIRFAGTVAAFSITRMGAQPSMPTPKELYRWQKN